MAFLGLSVTVGRRAVVKALGMAVIALAIQPRTAVAIRSLCDTPEGCAPPPPPVRHPISNGSLVRGTSSQAVFMHVGGAKFPVTPAELSALGRSAAEAIQLEDAVLASFGRVPGDGSVMRERTAQRPYIMSSGSALLVPTDDALRLLGVAPWVVVIPATGFADNGIQQVTIPSMSPTPASMVFGPNADGSDAGTRWPRSEFRGWPLINGCNVVELRGWLRLVGDVNIGDPDWHYSLEPDAEWLDTLGVDPGSVARVGDILWGLEKSENRFDSVAATPAFKIELNGWRDSVQASRLPKPTDWTISTEETGVNDAVWPWMPTHAADGSQLHHDMYVRVSGSLLTDQPHAHAPGKELADDLGVLFGSDTVTNYEAAAQGWQGSAGTTDPNNPARWTEIHPPDIIEVLPAKAKAVALRGVCVLARSAVTSTSGVDNSIDTFLTPPGPRPAHFRARIAESVGWETRFGSITAGNSARNGAAITLTKDGARVSVSVHGDAFGGAAGKFKALYRLWWEPDPGPWLMSVSMTPATPPLGQLVDAVVTASDSDTKAAIYGTVQINGVTVGNTGVPFRYRFAPRLRGRPGSGDENPVPIVVTVTAPNYIDGSLDITD